MSKSLINTRLRKTLKKVTQPQTGWMDVFPAIIGRRDGTVLTGTPGIIYVRNILNGQVLTVYNFTVPNIARLQVDVGRKVETPGLWQVKGVRETYAVPAGGSYPSNSHTHDNLFVSRDKIIPLLVAPISGTLTVQVYGSAVIVNNRWAIVENQQIDLSDSQPSAGARYVVLQYDDTGAVTTKNGDVVDAKEILTPSDIPDADDGNVPFCAVRMYNSQTELIYPDDFVYPFNVGGTVSTISTLKKYRQFVYSVSGGNFEFVIDNEGNPIMGLQNLEDA